MTPLLRKILGMNWVLVLVMYGFLIFGVFMIESAARHIPISPEVRAKFGSAGSYYAWMQKNWIAIGSVAYFAAAFVDYKWIKWLTLPFYIASLALMVLSLGDKLTDVHQIRFGPVSFQPVQLGIAYGILLLAWLLQDLPTLHRWFASPVARIATVGLVSGAPCLLAMKMGDMGSALVWIPVAIVALLMSGTPFRYLTFMSLIGAGILPLLYFVALPLISERGPERIEVWLRMLEDKPVDVTKEAYAPHTVSMAVGKAGFKGVGWNETAEHGSLHAKAFIPYKTAHNDYIFAVISEEMGFRGNLLLITAFALLLVQALFIAFYSRDVSGRLIVCLVVALIFAHVFENIGMCILLTPITGIPLPFISYSGTFIVICMFLFGLVQSVWIHRNPRLA